MNPPSSVGCWRGYAVRPLTDKSRPFAMRKFLKGADLNPKRSRKVHEAGQASIR